MTNEEQKNKILTDYFNSGRLKVKIDGYYKGKLHISRYTKIAEEIELQVWLELSKYPADKMVERYNRNPNSLEALAVTISKYQMMHKRNNPDSPNNSFGTKLIFGSNYFSGDYISATDSYSETNETGDYTGIPIADVEDNNYFRDRDNSPDRQAEIFKRLTPEEIEFVTALWNGEKFYKRKPTNQYKEFRTYVFNKIQNMNIHEDPTPLQHIQNKLTMSENKLFNVMFDEDLSRAEKIKKLKYSEQQYIAQRRILLKKIKALNIR
ncbi:hypothetical protein [Mucilaginibacter sp.]|uniref:hypothetical protein n=1 Tax=Mucilaginibacter sp. TaxID=1882438 RepID=UPI003D14A235